MQRMKGTVDRFADRRIVQLGKARDLTRAEIVGTQAELIGFRLYTPGG